VADIYSMPGMMNECPQVHFTQTGFGDDSTAGPAFRITYPQPGTTFNKDWDDIPAVPHWEPPKRVAQRCPVCDGRGTVPIGFYSDIPIGGSTQEPTCRFCGGLGGVWG
jgi:hypothetical protein